MPDMVEQMYCSQQIAIPAMFPYILKQYAKAAIRTQPYDLLRWSAAYFNAMANGETPPVKYRIEYPAPETESGLTPGYLRVLLKQLGVTGQVPAHVLYDKWMGVCLNESCLREMLAIGGFRDMVDWLHFVAIAAAHLSDSLAMTMCLCCELLTEEPEGGSAMIPCDTFLDIYNFLARLDCGPPREASVETVVETEQVYEPIIPISDDDIEIDNEVPGESAPATPRESTGEYGDPELGEEGQSKDQEVEGEGFSEASAAGLGTAEELRTSSPGEDVIPELPESLPDAVKSTSGYSEDQLMVFPGEEPGEDEAGAGEDEAGAGEVERVEDVEPLQSEESIPAPEESECSVEEVVERCDESVQTAPLIRHVPGIGSAVSGEQVTRVELYMRSWADRQQGMVMPRNIHHFLCPPLDSLLVPRDFQVDSTQDVHDQSYLYPQRRPLTCEDINKP